MNDQSAVSFDPAADYYDATRGFPPGVENEAAQLFIKAADLNEQSRVLEIGVGTGRIALPLAKHVGHYVGVDIARKMMAVLQTNQGSRRVDIAQADAAQLPFPDATFDTVISVHVFHLIPAWQQALQEVRRVLKPGGVLLYAGGGASLLFELRHIALGPHFATAGIRRDDLKSFLFDSGWKQTHRYTYFYEVEIAPIAVRQQLLSRQWEQTWFMSDAEIESAADRLKKHLQEHFENPSQPIRMDSTFGVEVLCPPQQVGAL